MPTTESESSIEILQLIDEQSRIAADPSIFFKRLCEIFTQFERVGYASAWMRFNTKIQAIQHVVSPQLRKAENQSEFSIAAINQNWFGSILDTFNLNSQNGLNSRKPQFFRTHSTVVSKILFFGLQHNGEVKCVFGVGVKHSANHQSIDDLRQYWNEVAWCAQQGFESCVDRVHSSRTSVWEAERVSPRKVNSTETSVEPPIAASSFLEKRIDSAIELIERANLNSEGAKPGANPTGNIVVTRDNTLKIEGTSGIEEAGAYYQSLSNSLAKYWHYEQVANFLTNELKNKMDGARVSIAWRVRGKLRIVAVSGVAKPNSKSELVRDLEQIIRTAVKENGDLWCTKDQWSPNDADLRLRDLVQHHFTDKGCKSLAILFVRSSSQDDESPSLLNQTIEEDSNQDANAVIVIEGIRNGITKEMWDRFWTPFGPLIRSTIKRSVQIQNVPLLNILSKIQSLLKPAQKLPIRSTTIAWISLVGILALLLVPVEMPLYVHGTILPQNRAKIHSEIAGTVEEVLLQDGDSVDIGTPILRLRNKDLDLEIAKVIGDLNETERSLAAVRDQLGQPTTSIQNDTETKKDRAVLVAKQKSLECQLEILYRKKEQLTIKSPMKGRLVSWDTPRRLTHLPVEPGAHLLTIAEEEGAWEIELQVPDNATGYLRNYFAANKRQQKSSELSFIVASQPSVTLTADMSRIAECTTFDERAGDVLRAYATVSVNHKQELEDVKFGSSIVAKVPVGRAPWIYANTFQFLDSVRRTLFKYW